MIYFSFYSNTIFVIILIYSRNSSVIESKNTFVAYEELIFYNLIKKLYFRGRNINILFYLTVHTFSIIQYYISI